VPRRTNWGREAANEGTCEGLQTSFHSIMNDEGSVRTRMSASSSSISYFVRKLLDVLRTDISWCVTNQKENHHQFYFVFSFVSTFWEFIFFQLVCWMALLPADMADLARLGILSFVSSGFWGFALESHFYADFSLLISQSRFLIRVSSDDPWSPFFINIQKVVPFKSLCYLYGNSMWITAKTSSDRADPSIVISGDIHSLSRQTDRQK
jgi:hypothetical protein